MNIQLGSLELQEFDDVEQQKMIVTFVGGGKGREVLEMCMMM